MVHLALSDIIIILAYFAGVLFVGFRSGKKTTKDEEDFLLAGRSLTLPIFVMTLVSTWYGGILGVGEFYYRYGISSWIIQGVPYYIFAALFAVFLSKKIRATNLFSLPDKLEQSYDKKTAVMGAFLTFILMTPAPYILMLSVFIQMLFGWNMFICLIVTSVVAVSYLYVGGFRADVETDVVEFVLMFLGFAVIIPYCVSNYGGFEFLQKNLPPLHLVWHGGNTIQFIIVWFFIALWTLVDPAFHQRCYAAKDGKTARNGILVSIIFWFIFDCMTATAGLYSRAALPNITQPITSYPMLAETILPPIAKGFFYVGMLATIMSTLNTLAFVSAQTLGRDIYLRLRIKDFGAENKESDVFTRWTKIGLIISFIISIVFALLMPSVIEIWYTVGTVIIPGLLVPLIASYFEGFKISARYGFVAMMAGWVISLCWLLAKYIFGNGTEYPLGVEPMYPGLAASLIMWAMGRMKN